MSEYNPFDIAPPTPEPSNEKPKPEVEKPAQQAGQAPSGTDQAYAPSVGIDAGQAYAPSVGTGAEIRYAQAPVPAQRPSAPAPPGRAPLAGQPASGGPVIPSAPSSHGTRPATPPPPQPAAQAAPQSRPGVQYDLGGNPLPQSAQSPQLASSPQAAAGCANPTHPQAAPPHEQQYASAVRYDLAGNPLPPQLPPQPAAPPPPAPGAPYGYSPGSAPGYGGGGYQSAPPPSSSAPTPIVPAGMEEAMTNGANWMIGIVLLTFASIWLNKLTYPFMMPYVSYAAISGAINIPFIFAHALGYTTAAVLASIALIPLALLAILGFRRQAWVFMIAMIIYGIDIPVTIVTWLLHFRIWGIILGTAWHSFVFQRMFAAFTAAREINATMAGRRI